MLVEATNAGTNLTVPTLTLSDLDAAAVSGQFTGAIHFKTADTGNPGVNASIVAEVTGSGGGAQLNFSTGFAGALVETLVLSDTGNATFAGDVTLSEGAVSITDTANETALAVTSSATSTYVTNITAGAVTTGQALRVVGVDALTTGKIAHFRSNSSSTSTRTLVQVHNDNTAATGATALTVTQDAAQRALFIDQNGNGSALVIDSAATTANGVDWDFDSLTTGHGLDIRSDSSSTSSRAIINVIQENAAASGAVGISVRQDGADAAIELNGGGIKFTNATASGDVNTLDDYEEGTWTPVFWDGTNDQTGSSVQSATYTKIGRVVYIEMCVLNVDTTGMTAGSPVYIKGLPFTPASAGVNDKNVIGAVQCDNVTTDSGSVFLRTITSQTYARLIEQTTTGEAGLIISDITSGNADFRINGFYIAAN